MKLRKIQNTKSGTRYSCDVCIQFKKKGEPEPLGVESKLFVEFAVDSADQ